MPLPPRKASQLELSHAVAHRPGGWPEMSGSDRWNAAPTTFSGAESGLATKCDHVLLNTLRSASWPSRLYMATKFSDGWPSSSTCPAAQASDAAVMTRLQAHHHEFTELQRAPGQAHALTLIPMPGVNDEKFMRASEMRSSAELLPL